MKQEFEKRAFMTDYAVIIISNFHAYTNYYDTWESAQQSFMRLAEHLKGNNRTLVREIILTFKDEIKAIKVFCNIK